MKKATLGILLLITFSCSNLNYQNKIKRKPSNTTKDFATAGKHQCLSLFKSARSRFHQGGNYGVNSKLLKDKELELRKIINREFGSHPENIQLAMRDGELLNKLQEVNFFTNTEAKIAFLDYYDKGLLKADSISSYDELAKLLEGWDFTKSSQGINSQEIYGHRGLLYQIYLLKRKDQKGIHSLLNKAFITPETIVYKWYLHNVYSKGLKLALGKLYKGDTQIAKTKRNINFVRNFMWNSFLTIFSSFGVGLKQVNFMKFKNTSEDFDYWLTTPFNIIEQELREKFRFHSLTTSIMQNTGRLLIAGSAVVLPIIIIRSQTQSSHEKNKMLYSKKMDRSFMTGEVSECELKKNYTIILDEAYEDGERRTSSETRSITKDWKNMRMAELNRISYDDLVKLYSDCFTE